MSEPGPRNFRYYDLIMAAYVCILLCANLIGPAKVATIHHVPLFGDVTFVAGVLFFPLSYIFGDILTEVYGYARDRRCVWAGFGALAFAALMASVIVALPAASWWQEQQKAVETVFGNTWRIVAASIVAFWCGSFVNSYVLAKMKIMTQGRWLRGCSPRAATTASWTSRARWRSRPATASERVCGDPRGPARRPAHRDSGRRPGCSSAGGSSRAVTARTPRGRQP